MAKLIYRHGTESREIPLTEQPLSVGRTPEADVCVNDRLLSRKHAVFRLENGRYMIHDLASTNGTFVNDEPITQRPLTDGDIVRIGEATFVYVADAAPAKTAPAIEAPRRKKGDPITRIAESREIVRHIDEIAEPLSLELTPESLGTGQLSHVGQSINKVAPTREARMFFILYQVCREVSTAVTLDDILRKAISLCFDVILAEKGAILLQEGGELKPRIAFRRGEGIVPPSDVPFSRNVVARVIKDRVAVVSNDTMQDEQFREALSIVNLNIRSALCVPLWAEKEILGAIYIDNRAASHAFTPQDMELMTAIGNVVAVRIRQERLNQRLKQEEFLRTNLARYHPPDVIEMLVRTGQDVRLGISTRDVSVVFADIVDSTRLAEKIGPEAITDLLNRFYEVSSSAVFSEHGHVNNYMGDGVLSIFNATTDLEDHPVAAVRSCVRMIKEIDRLNRSDPESAFQVRVGANTGAAAVGNVGGESRIQYTALGDPVNAADRLCKLATPNHIVIGEITYERLGGLFECKPLGTVTLKGKEQAMKAYELVVPE